GRSPVDPLPAREEPSERGLLRRLDLLPEGGERGPAEAAQDVGIAPLAFGSTGPKLAANELLRPFQRAELSLRHRDVEAEAGGRLRGRKGTAPSREPCQEAAERPSAGLEERLGQTGGRHR